MNGRTGSGRARTQVKRLEGRIRAAIRDRISRASLAKQTIKVSFVLSDDIGIDMRAVPARSASRMDIHNSSMGECAKHCP